jgi:hypothetical protein
VRAIETIAKRHGLLTTLRGFAKIYLTLVQGRFSTARIPKTLEHRNMTATAFASFLVAIAAFYRHCRPCFTAPIGRLDRALCISSYWAAL